MQDLKSLQLLNTAGVHCKVLEPWLTSLVHALQQMSSQSFQSLQSFQLRCKLQGLLVSGHSYLLLTAW